ncbi:hypothetical protein KM043_002555 [Ampulex compressa]|nr:hypothetical protein KM043_002555 [Ampulex compressa]
MELHEPLLLSPRRYGENFAWLKNRSACFSEKEKKKKVVPSGKYLVHARPADLGVDKIKCKLPRDPSGLTQRDPPPPSHPPTQEGSKILPLTLTSGPQIDAYEHPSVFPLAVPALGK